MHGQRTKIALAITTAVRSNRVFNRLHRPHFPFLFVVRVNLSFKIQIIDGVNFRRRQIRLGRILNKISRILFLKETLCRYRVGIFIKYFKHIGELLFIRFYRFKGGYFQVPGFCLA